MRAVFKQRAAQFLLGTGLTCVAAALGAQQSVDPAVADCDKPVYLTFDTGHMGVAPLIAEVLDRTKTRATFFIANEPTRTGGMSLDETWAPWWKKMAEQGHVFATHTFDHVYWLADLPGYQFKVRPSSGPDAGRIQTWNTQQYCEELARVDVRFEQMTGRKTLPLFRAPGGKTSPDLIRAGASCGYAHVGWSPAGFLGDELPSAQYPNAALLERALKNIRAGDILMAHLGIWSRQDAWAPAVLEPLIVGLKQKGFCFATIDQHRDYREWLKKYARTPALGVTAEALQSTIDFEPEEDDTEDADPALFNAPDLGTQVPLSNNVDPKRFEPYNVAPVNSVKSQLDQTEQDIKLLDISTEKK